MILQRIQNPFGHCGVIVQHCFEIREAQLRRIDNLPPAVFAVNIADKALYCPVNKSLHLRPLKLQGIFYSADY